MPNKSEEKQLLRDRLLAARKTHHATYGATAARQLAAHAQAIEAAIALAIEEVALHGDIGAGAIIAAYLPIGSEIDIKPLTAALAAQGHDIALPVCLAKSEPVIFRRYKQGDKLAPDAMNILAPTQDAETLVPHIVLLPLLGFDRDGMRLGRGGGYYDRTLAALRAHGKSRAFGIAYDMQMVDKCPPGPHDQAVDAVITERAIYRFERD